MRESREEKVSNLQNRRATCSLVEISERIVDSLEQSP